METKCENCKYFDGRRCHRFPEEVLKSKEGYCGEFEKTKVVADKKDKK